MYIWQRDKPTSSANIGQPSDNLSFNIRKIHGIDDNKISQPVVYEDPIIKTKGKVYKLGDTIYLKRINKELIEFEVIANSSINFYDVNIIAKQGNSRVREKPHINEKEACVSLKGNKALFAFRPWVYTSDLNNLVEVEINCKNLEVNVLTIPVVVLDNIEYEKYISNHLLPTQRNTWLATTKRYKQRLNTAWVTKEVGNGRRSYSTSSLSAKRFFADKQYHSGKYTNEYFAHDGDFKITLFADQTPIVIVEPINLLL